ncbi:nickel-dependent hydrogenase large subunit [Thalassomonas actiniarum]|uniref:Uptake hydrogenase large subunit n=1 Tax=Thalassomonas actiniarum TaxID=485447 RepID=A0AAE9YV76_9GAMM|nr:nickel-dependent hydrogenase large subunit [Thalassomonas actiniarum]WDE00969.1 nickel-dependent hydrogenase large subunit [Thalassomonas actiniarum]
MGTEEATSSEVKAAGVSPELMGLIGERKRAELSPSLDVSKRFGGSLAVYCRTDIKNKTVLEAATMSTPFKGYESLLPGRDLQDVGRVSSMASGICGGVHATASALCLEMALALTPPALGIVLRNLLLSCQYLNDNCMHLFVLAGPDYSQQVIENTNPEIWQRARQASSRSSHIHGYKTVADIMLALNRGQGNLYKQAMKMTSLARQAYTLLGGKYPHSESIIPGGVSINISSEQLNQFKVLIQSFAEYSQQSAAIWDDIFDFMLEVEPQYEEMGKSAVALLDFGQWDHPEHYDASYKNCDHWGQKRWSTPAAIIDGKLVCERLSKLNAGMEEFLDYSFQTRASLSKEELIKQDPLGNPISAFHPWNKKIQATKKINPQAYSWGSSLTWQGRGFEVGAYSRLYLTALAQKIPHSQYLTATGVSLDFALPTAKSSTLAFQWKIPKVWNAFERNRARAYALAFSFSVIQENIDIAQKLISSGETQTHVPIKNNGVEGRQLGVGLWGASRGFLAHWAVLDDKVIDNYQIAIPSRINVGTRTSKNELSPLEKALINTPIIESRFNDIEEFKGIDIQRTIQSFDPCMRCSAHISIEGRDLIINRDIDTDFPF